MTVTRPSLFYYLVKADDSPYGTEFWTHASSSPLPSIYCIHSSTESEMRKTVNSVSQSKTVVWLCCGKGKKSAPWQEG